VNVELERMWMYAIVADFRYYAGIFLEALRKIMKTLGQGSQLFGRDSNQAGAKYKTEVLPSEPVRLV
jgi:hypothetical protein